MKNVKFFLGANSNIGFKSYFRQLQGQDLQLLILKGGAGSGKSSLMKRVFSFANERGHEIELIPCASDPHSLDAVIDHTQKFAIMDGTSPHVEDPLLAGVSAHIMYTGDLWDMKKLRSKKEEIAPLAEKISDCHKSATAYIKSAASLLSENLSYTEKFIDKQKADRLVKRITDEAFTNDKGCEKTRLLSAVSVGETVLFEDTVSLLCDRVYVLCDKFGSAADFILEKIRFYAKEKEQEFIFCPCSIISGKCDHLIFPKSHTAIVTENTFLPFSVGEKVDMAGFYKPLPLYPHLIKRISLARDILPLAEHSVKEAKNLHDDLEKYYIEAMDFSGMDALFDKILYHFYDHFPQRY